MYLINYLRVKRRDAISRDHSHAKQVQKYRACFNASPILDYVIRNIHLSKYICIHMYTSTWTLTEYFFIKYLNALHMNEKFCLRVNQVERVIPDN